MKRYEWEFPVAPEHLQLQVVQVPREVSQERQFAIRAALLERMTRADSSFDDCHAAATIHPRGNA
jgi:hypothetical protein